MGTMLSCNVNKVKTATLKGRKYLVANVTLIVPGVLNGSKGALFYPRDEVSHPNNVDAWNGMPLVNGHPTQDGAHVSARSPGVMEQFGLGHVYNARINPKTGSLRAQAWFDVESMERVEPRILQALEAGRPVEVSTGLFTHDEPAPEGSVYNGKEYQYVARKYRPDHLAILIDQEGACSLRDGCGVMVENAMSKMGDEKGASGGTAMTKMLAKVSGAKPFTSKVLDDGMHHHFYSDDPKASAKKVVDHFAAKGMNPEVSSEKGLWTVEVEMDGEEHIIHFIDGKAVTNCVLNESNVCLNCGGPGSGKPGPCPEGEKNAQSVVPKNYKKPATVFETRQDAEKFARSIIPENFKTVFDKDAGAIRFDFPNGDLADKYEDQVKSIGKAMKIRVTTGVSRDLTTRSQDAENRQFKIDQQRSIRARQSGRTNNAKKSKSGDGRWVTTETDAKLFIEGGEAKTKPGGKKVDGGGYKSKHDGTEYQSKDDRDSDDRHFDKKKSAAKKARAEENAIRAKLEAKKKAGPDMSEVDRLKGKLGELDKKIAGFKERASHRAAAKNPPIQKTISDEDWDKNVAGLEKARQAYRDARKAGKKGEAKSRLADARRFRKTLIGNAANPARAAQLAALNCGGKGGKPGPCPEGKTVAGIPITIKPMGTGQETSEYTTARHAAFSASSKARDASNAAPPDGDVSKLSQAATVASKLANGGGKSLPGRTSQGRHSSLHKKAASAHTKTADAHRAASSQYAISRPDASLKHAKAAEAHSAAAAAHTKAGHELMIVGNRTLNRSTNGGRTMAATRTKDEKTLTKTEAVQFLTTNCDCWKAKGAKTTLNALPDETLNSLVASEQLATAVRNRLGEKAATLTVNQLAESLADPEVELELIEDETPVENCDMGGGEVEETEEAEGTEAEEAAPPPFAKKKLKKKGPPMATPTGNAAATPQRMTMEQWTAIAPLEVLERDARAKQVVNGERDRIVAKLVANSAARTKDQKDQLRKTLNTKTLDDLNLMALLQVNRKAPAGDERPTNVPNYGGLGHSYEEPVFNEGVNEDGSINDEDGMLVHNTASVKWADEVKLYAPTKKAM